MNPADVKIKRCYFDDDRKMGLFLLPYLHIGSFIGEFVFDLNQNIAFQQKRKIIGYETSPDHIEFSDPMINNNIFTMEFHNPASDGGDLNKCMIQDKLLRSLSPEDPIRIQIQHDINTESMKLVKY